MATGRCCTGAGGGVSTFSNLAGSAPHQPANGSHCGCVLFIVAAIATVSYHRDCFWFFPVLDKVLHVAIPATLFTSDNDCRRSGRHQLHLLTTNFAHGNCAAASDAILRGWFIWHVYPIPKNSHTTKWIHATSAAKAIDNSTLIITNTVVDTLPWGSQRGKLPKQLSLSILWSVVYWAAPAFHNLTSAAEYFHIARHFPWPAVTRAVYPAGVWLWSGACCHRPAFAL